MVEDDRNPVAGPGWYPDPWRRGTYRWWSGTSWEGYVWPPARPRVHRPAAAPVTAKTRLVSASATISVLLALIASIALSYYGDAHRQGMEACASSARNPLMGYSFLALLFGSAVAVPAIWSTVRVLRVSVGFRASALRAGGLVLIVVGLPLALASLAISEFSYACLF